MPQPQAPIAVFDSGLGGISVLRELVRLMPEESFLYFGDSRNAPYGPRPTAEVGELTAAAAKALFARGCKALVVACNTATSAAIGALRADNPARIIIGIEPALKPAVMAFDHPNVLVMATEMTLKEEKFHRLMNSYRDRAEIFRLPAPGIVTSVEQGRTRGPELDAYLREILAPYQDKHMDAIVLGCTHFPLVQGAIAQAMGYPVRIFDGAAGTARETRRRLEEAGLRCGGRERGHVELTNSLGTEEILRLSRSLLQG